MMTKAALIQPIFPKGALPIPLSLKHRKIKQFQYTFSSLKSIGNTLSRSRRVKGEWKDCGAG
jgi:hypothetical protein